MTHCPRDPLLRLLMRSNHSDNFALYTILGHLPTCIIIPAWPARSIPRVLKLLRNVNGMQRLRVLRPSRNSKWLVYLSLIIILIVRNQSAFLHDVRSCLLTFIGTSSSQFCPSQNEAAKNIQCKICFQTFLQTSREPA